MKVLSSGAVLRCLLIIFNVILSLHVCSGNGVIRSKTDRMINMNNNIENKKQDIVWGTAIKNTAYFDDSTETNITAVVGQRAQLPCRVHNLAAKDVSWIRKRDIHILTAGPYTYTSDDRFRVAHHKGSNDWILEITSVTFRDAGVYECQVSTSPKIFLPVLLNVEVQQARIEGPVEIIIKNGSTISLTCLVNTHSENVGTVSWYRDGKHLDYDDPRGGVSLEVEKTPAKTTSKLFITRAMRADSGNYTCAPQFADAASVSVHVVSGEESAAVQTSSAVREKSIQSVTFSTVVLAVLYMMHHVNLHQHLLCCRCS